MFFGWLEWTSEENDRQEMKVCLKLFDEAFFPIDEEECYDDFDSPFVPTRSHLRQVQRASDTMRQEYAAYERLQYLQGTLLPHAHGFHEHTLLEGRKLYGFFMEIIEGPQLSKLELDEWPVPVKLRIVHYLRHALRALHYGGVKQDDWHLGQILMTLRAIGCNPRRRHM